jgi:hypothetical protein
VRVSSLYRQGVPQDHVEHTLTQRTKAGEFRFSLIPGEDSIFVNTWWRPPDADDWKRLERRTKVEWVDWSFGSRRPFVVCPGCERRVSRAFITTAVLAGTLICHRCAGVRYRSQDAPLAPRLAERADSIRVRLGGSSVHGRTGEPAPAKPPRMHWRTYDRLTTELLELEVLLKELERVRMLNTLGEAYASRQWALERFAELEKRAARKRRQ